MSDRLKDIAEGTRHSWTMRHLFLALLTLLSGSSAQDDVLELYIDQKLNHFDASDRRSFSQRYFRSDRFVLADSPRPLVFLCVGGEGPPLDASILVDSVHCSGDMLETAAMLRSEGRSVQLYALEHRYYGRSYPTFPDGLATTNEHLIYLSSRQAIQDIAHFVSAMHKGGEWVTFGGSYPGVIAAWARAQLPHLITAAVSSSAPLVAQVDFPGYKNHVGEDLTSACWDVSSRGHKQIWGLAQQPEERHRVATDFNLCDVDALDDERSVRYWLGEGVVYFAVQGNDPSCQEELCNIEKRCEFLTDSSFEDPYHALQALANKQFGDECVDISWEQQIQDLTVVSDENMGERSWLWQTCTEFGYYQTCQLLDCPFLVNGHTLDFDIELCEHAFGVVNVQENIDATNEWHGGWNLTSSKIISVKGSVDPWSELALPNSYSTGDMPVFEIQGASHHFWTHPSKYTDSEEVRRARYIIQTTLRDWLGLSTHSHVSV